MPLLMMCSVNAITTEMDNVCVCEVQLPPNVWHAQKCWAIGIQ